MSTMSPSDLSQIYSDWARPLAIPLPELDMVHSSGYKGTPTSCGAVLISSTSVPDLIFGYGKIEVCAECH